MLKRHSLGEGVGKVVRQSQRRAGGFSLIELLITVLVIVLLTSVVSLGVGDGGRNIKRFELAEHLVALMAYAQSEAELSGADHGLYLERRSAGVGEQYVGHWLRRYDQGWAEPRGSAEVLAPLLFDEDTAILLTVASDPDVEITEGDPELRPAPQIVFFASGEVTEGDLSLIVSGSGELVARLDWDLFGRVTLESPRSVGVDD